jgi:hypothetical protein
VNARVEVRLERVVGRKVLAPDGRSIGRLQEIRVSLADGEWVVTECHIGTAALLERLAGRILKFPRVFNRGFAASWDQIDWTARGGLRLLCPVEELRRFTRRVPAKPSPR